MPFLDDFEAAVRTYPANSVTLEIVDVTPVAPSIPPSVNTNEIWAFQVRIRNNGLLNMTGVSLEITAQNGAQVSTTATGPWVASIPSFGNLTINAHGGQQDTVNLYFKAPPAVRPANTELACARIGAFDVNLNHILIDHSDSSSLPRSCYRNQVFPS